MQQSLFGLTGLFVISCFLATPAESADAEGNVYAFANIGNARTEFRTSSVDVISDDDLSFDLGIGYRFGQYLSVEGAYHDFGEPIGYAGCPPEVLCIQAFAPDGVSIDGWSAALVARTALNDWLEVFGKVGLMSWDASARSPSLNDSGTDLLYGAGLTWNATGRWGIQLSFERVDLDIDTAKIGALYRF